jgi:hypothetical protein
MKDAHLLSSSLNSEMYILATAMWPFSLFRRASPETPQTTRIRRFHLFLTHHGRFALGDKIRFAQDL